MATFIVVFVCTFLHFLGENIVLGSFLVDFHVFSPSVMVFEGRKSKKDIVLQYAF